MRASVTELLNHASIGSDVSRARETTWWGGGTQGQGDVCMYIFHEMPRPPVGGGGPPARGMYVCTSEICRSAGGMYLHIPPPHQVNITGEGLPPGGYVCMYSPPHQARTENSGFSKRWIFKKRRAPRAKSFILFYFISVLFLFVFYLIYLFICYCIYLIPTLFYFALFHFILLPFPLCIPVWFHFHTILFIFIVGVILFHPTSLFYHNPICNPILLYLFYCDSY
jgi:hypothetical protein